MEIKNKIIREILVFVDHLRNQLFFLHLKLIIYIINLIFYGNAVRMLWQKFSSHVTEYENK